MSTASPANLRPQSPDANRAGRQNPHWRELLAHPKRFLPLFKSSYNEWSSDKGPEGVLTSVGGLSDGSLTRFD
jgi:hypothetical protein